MHAEIDNSVPVVILRSGHHGGLGIARSLGRLGVPVYSVDGARWEPAFASRYCLKRFLLDIARGPAAAGDLRSIGHDVGNRPILIPTTDEGCIWVAENEAVLRGAFRFPIRDAELVRMLCDKGRMQELARRHGVATAQSVTPRSQEDVERYSESVVFPVMVKEKGGGRLRRRVGGTKFILETPRELLDFCARVGDLEDANMMIQEFIPGEDWMFDGYFNARSECLFGMTGQKIRRFPARTGVTSLGVCLPNETVLQTTTRFMRAIGYRGILDIGYRRDSRDGSYKVLDVNPRIGCTFRLFAANDLDVARALYLDLTAQPVPAAESAAGRKWFVEDFDLISALGSWRDGSLSFKAWVRSFVGVREAACFALDDPLPFLMMAITDCCELLHWRRGQAAVRQRPREEAQPISLAS